jgi:hypothetical protein
MSRDTGSVIGELCVDAQRFMIEAQETLFGEAVICTDLYTPEPTASPSTDPHQLSIGLTIAVASVVGACVLGVILVCVCLLRRKKSDQLLPASGFYKP